jgi:hypothetical protein
MTPMQMSIIESLDDRMLDGIETEKDKREIISEINNMAAQLMENLRILMTDIDKLMVEKTAAANNTMEVASALALYLEVYLSDEFVIEKK